MLFYLISKCKYVLSDEGYLNHISNAFNKKIFVVMSGFTRTDLVNYENSVFISRIPQIECAPCYLTKQDCFRSKKYCTEDINVSDVIKEINSKG